MTKYEFLKAVTDSLRAAHPDRDVTAVMVEATLAMWLPQSCWAAVKSR